MTKAKTEFANEDLALARRALWILEGHAPGPEQPPPDIELDRLMSYNGSDGFALPLAHFAVIRYGDAVRAAQPPTTLADHGHPPNARAAEAAQRRAAQHEACRLEKKASEQLREALLRSDKAVDAWKRAADKRAPGWAKLPPQYLTGEHQRILEALVAAQQATRKAFVQLDVSVRQLPPVDVIDSFPSTFGLPLAERNDALADQALSLFETGIPVEDIGYVMGWNYGIATTPEQSKERTRKRLEEARERRMPLAP